MIYHLLVFLQLLQGTHFVNGDLAVDVHEHREWKPSAPTTVPAAAAARNDNIHHDSGGSMTTHASHDLHSIEQRTKQLRNLLYESAAYGSLVLSALVFGVASYLCYASHDSVVRRQLNDRRHNVQPIAITYKKRQ